MYVYIDRCKYKGMKYSRVWSEGAASQIKR